MSLLERLLARCRKLVRFREYSSDVKLVPEQVAVHCGYWLRWHSATKSSCKEASSKGCLCLFEGRWRCCNLFHTLSLVLVTGFFQLKLSVEGRPVPKLLQSSKGGSAEETTEIVYGRGLKAMIGSAPPSCQRRCPTCVHCEAIQVPTTPQFKNRKQRTAVASISSIVSDTSNYKPMSWKCKCGDFIYNP